MVACRIENAGTALCAAVSDADSVAAAQRAAIAPASTCNQLRWFIDRCDDKVGLVRDKLTVDAESAADGSLDLRGRVVTSLKATHRSFNKSKDRGYVLNGRGADSERHSY